ncbi:hypothetical protein ACU4HD_19655 [Cupriavidus basilensis]
MPMTAAIGLRRESRATGWSPNKLASLFQQCFGPGRNAPLERPTMSEWRAALELALNMLVSCGNCGSMFYFNPNLQCNFCDHVESAGRHLLLRHFLHAPELKDEPGIEGDCLIRTGYHQVLNDTPVELRASPPGTVTYAQSDAYCTLTLTDDGLCIDPVRGMSVQLQTQSDANLKLLKRREIRAPRRVRETYALHLRRRRTPPCLVFSVVSADGTR